METTQAPDGTVRGVLPGANPQAASLLLGARYDPVIGAGKYDGTLGIIAALTALDALRQEKTNLPYPVHLLAFSDDEGIRFQTTYLGSRSITAPLDAETLAAKDAAEVTVQQAIASESPAPQVAPIHYAPTECRGYVELHIEQGRMLEETDESACVVSSIAGQSRLTVTLTGRADHAGTTPMPLRRDALTGAAVCILAAESLAQSSPPLVITIGKIHVHPGASNSIPQSSTFTIDLRHSDDTIRRTSLEILHASFRQIAVDRERKSASGISITATAKPTPPTTARRSKATASPASGMNC